MAEMAKRVPELEKNGTNRFADRCRLPTPKTEGRSSEYLIARIKRDRPDIADRMESSDGGDGQEGADTGEAWWRPNLKATSVTEVGKRGRNHRIPRRPHQARQASRINLGNPS